MTQSHEVHGYRVVTDGRKGDRVGRQGVDTRQAPLVEPRDVATAPGRTRWITASDAGAAVLIAAHLALVTWVVAGGGPYRDDFRLQAKALEEPLLTWMFLSPESHFAPLPRLIIFLQATFAPWSQASAIGTTLLLVAGQATLFWLLMREICGPRAALLPVMAVYAISPALVPAAAWWTQAVTLTPANMGFLGTMLMVARFSRTRATPDLVGALVAYGLGLLCWEKALLALPASLTLVAIVLEPTVSVRASARRVASHWPLWAGMLVLTVAHLTWYVLGPFDSGGETTEVTPALAVEYAWVNLTRALVPGLVGGPWSWDVETSPHFGIADPSGGQQAFAALLVTIALGLAWSRSRRRTLSGVVLVAAVWLPGLAMLLVGRVTKFGIVPAFDYRYLPEVVITAMLAFALAVVPWRGEIDPRPWTRIQSAAVAALMVIVILGAMLSTTRWANAWHANPARDYAERLRADVQSQPEPRRIYDTTMPTAVLSPLFTPYDRLSVALGPLNRDGRLDFDAANPPAWTVRQDGAVVPGKLQILASGAAGPLPNCGWSVSPERPDAVIPMEPRVPALPNTVLRLSMLNGIDTTLVVEVLADGQWRPADGDGSIAVTAGLDAVLMRVDDAAVSAVRVTTLASESGSCIDEVLLGVPVPSS